MGCGTGIATTQLYKNGAQVVGTDIDEQMIQIADTENHSKIRYQIAPAEKQPFSDHTFDAITAFSAFHWFTHTKALNEIARVLKSDGVFFAVNKNESGDFKEQNKEILKRFISQMVPDVKEKYDPRKILEENGFRDVRERHFSATEHFNQNGALEYIQTMSIWNLVPVVNRYDALNDLWTRFSSIYNTYGTIARKLDVVVVSGRLKKCL
jgi:ubiquinone/menaquinone biosynthesis C-methylase UbiE